MVVAASLEINKCINFYVYYKRMAADPTHHFWNLRIAKLLHVRLSRNASMCTKRCGFRGFHHELSVMRCDVLDVNNHIWLKLFRKWGVNLVVNQETRIKTGGELRYWMWRLKLNQKTFHSDAEKLACPLTEHASFLVSTSNSKTRRRTLLQ